MPTYQVEAADGWRLGVHVHAAQGAHRGAVLLLHAMMVDARSLDRPGGAGLASHLARAGWEVHRADLRGRGASGPTVAEGGRWTYDDLVLRDLPALVGGVRARTTGPLVLVGHSLGAHVGLAATGIGAHAHPPDAHVLLAGNVWMPRLDGSRRKRLQKDLSLVLFRRAAALLDRWPARRLRMGPVDESGPYVADLCRFWDDDAWTSRDGQHDYLAGLSTVRGPVLAVVGARDRLFAHVEGARAFVEHLGPGRAAFWYVRDGQHGVDRAPDHMSLVTDPASRPVWARLARWLEGVENLDRAGP